MSAVVPYLGMFLTDLTMIHSAHSDTMPVSPPPPPPPLLIIAPYLSLSMQAMLRACVQAHAMMSMHAGHAMMSMHACSWVISFICILVGDALWKRGQNDCHLKAARGSGQA